jgi:hypothetical protein
MWEDVRGANPDGRIEVRRFDVKASSRLLFNGHFVPAI